MPLTKDRLYTIVMTPLLVAFAAAAADSFINGKEQRARCDAVMSETLQAVEDAGNGLQAYTDGNTEFSIHVSKDMRDDPDFPRFPIVGTSSCNFYVSVENTPSAE